MKSIHSVALLTAALLTLALGDAHGQSLTWTERATGIRPSAGQLMRITGAAHSGTRFVVVAQGLTGANIFPRAQSQAATSTDGVNWTMSGMPTNPLATGVAYGAGLFAVTCERFAVEFNGATQNILTSPDGVNWTPRNTGQGALAAITHTGTHWLAVGNPAGAPNQSNAAISTDGVNWSRFSIDSPTTILGAVVANPDLNVALVLAGLSRVLVSDGSSGFTNWQPTNPLSREPADASLIGLTFAGGAFVAAVRHGTTGTTGSLLYSFDGLAWFRAGAIAFPADFREAAIKGFAASGAPTSDGTSLVIVGQATRTTTTPPSSTTVPRALVSVRSRGNWTTVDFGGAGNISGNTLAFYGGGFFLTGNNVQQVYAAPAAPGGVANGPPRLANLSLLTSLAGAADSLTMGYVVGGAFTRGAKPVLIRAVGPSLAAFGVGDPLADPRLEFFAGAAKSGENDNWGGGGALTAAFDAVGAFRLPDAGSRDAAATSAVAAGGNSIVVSPVGNASGQVLVELYDATSDASLSGATPRLINFSVLKHIGPSLTVGFVLKGDAPRTVLIRAVGPTLGAAPFNVPGVAADPRLALFAGAAQINANDNWAEVRGLTAVFDAVGAFRLPDATSRDAAMVVTLDPGAYTAQVSGVGGSTGTALVEIYEVP